MSPTSCPASAPREAAPYCAGCGSSAAKALSSATSAAARRSRRARSQARDWGRFTRNFVVQASAAEWALCWMADLRNRLTALAPGRPLTESPHLVYFLHDVAPDEGVFSVVPGTHKSNYGQPYGKLGPDDEPGMIGLSVKAGDAIFFTEHTRHGGLINRSDKTRKTLHVGYGPHWMMSQNIATGDEPYYITDSTRKRLSKGQLELFRS